MNKKKNSRAAVFAAASKKVRKDAPTADSTPLTQRPGPTTPPRVPRVERHILTPVTPVVDPSVASDQSLTAIGGLRAAKSPGTTATDYFAGLNAANSTGSTFNMSSCGIAPARAPKRATTAPDKVSYVKIAIITGQAIALRIEPSDPDACAWAEKVFSDEIKAIPCPEWISSANISNFMYKYHINDVLVKNTRGFPLRIYVIYVENTDIPLASLLRLGNHVANSLTANKLNTICVKMPPDDDFVWMPDATWQEVIGTDSALRHLLDRTGGPFEHGYYEKNTTQIHAHFRKGMFSIPTACALFAPLDEIDPSVLNATSHEGIPLNPVHNRGGAPLDPVLEPDVLDLHNNESDDDEALSDDLDE